MDLDYVLVDVFAETKLAGNPLAVFPAAPGLPDDLMQAIARETNLSETVFVTSVEPTRYSSRIFMPDLELPFAGHPTLGTAWVLRDLGRLRDGACTQVTGAGETAVEFVGDEVWLERTGHGGTDISDLSTLAAKLGLDAGSIGGVAPDEGNGVRQLLPAISDAGIPQLMVPLRSAEAVDSLIASDFAATSGAVGAYCFSFEGPGEITARFFASGAGLAEDAATGSAAACLGLYLGRRLGPGRVSISQGRHIGRPSRLHVDFNEERVRVGGNVIPVGRGVLSV